MHTHKVAAAALVDSKNMHTHTYVCTYTAHYTHSTVVCTYIRTLYVFTCIDLHKKKVLIQDLYIAGYSTTTENCVVSE